MRTYSIFKYGNHDHTIKIQRAPFQFNWLGFAFPWIYLAIKQVWVKACIVFALMIPWSMFWSAIQSDLVYEGDKSGAGLAVIVSIIGTLAFGIYVGKKVNLWIETNLRSKGYTKVDTISAPNKELAMIQYLDGVQESRDQRSRDQRSVDQEIK